MALYIQYDLMKKLYHKALEEYNDALSAKEMLFAQTQPNGIRYDEEKVKSTANKNVNDEYLIRVEKMGLDEIIERRKEMAEGRAVLLRMLKQDLRDSKEPDDVIYYCRYVERMKIGKIAAKSHYSRAQVYRILDRINLVLGKTKNETK